MENAPNNPEEDSKGYMSMKTVRAIWMILIPVFIIVILLRLYNWNLGKDNIRGVFSPLGMVFLGLGQIVAQKNKNLSYVFLAVAVVLIVVGLIAMIIY